MWQEVKKNWEGMAENMADNEYSVQYYGFSPDTFFKEFSESVLEEMTLLIQHSLREFSSLTLQNQNKEKFIATSIKINNIWSQRAETILQKLKPTINDFFTIPKNVLLPEDSVHAKQFSETELQKLEQEVKMLEDKYSKERNAVKLYKAEIAMLEKLETVQKKVDEAVNSLNSVAGTLNAIKELETIAQTHAEYMKLIVSNEDDAIEENKDRLNHGWKFKSA